MGIPERWNRHRQLPQDIKTRLESLAPFLEKEGVLLAYLFGSLAEKSKAPRSPGGRSTDSLRLGQIHLVRAGGAFVHPDVVDLHPLREDGRVDALLSSPTAADGPGAVADGGDPFGVDAEINQELLGGIGPAFPEGVRRVPDPGPPVI